MRNPATQSGSEGSGVSSPLPLLPLPPPLPLPPSRSVAKIPYNLGAHIPIEVSMELGEQLNRQRVKHIISSYQLEGGETETFDTYLDELLQAYPSPLIELAIVETLVNNWITVPMLRGQAFLAKAHERIQTWENQMMAADGSTDSSPVSTIAPEQFQQITGLDPSPIFGSGLPSAQPPHPLGSGF